MTDNKFFETASFHIVKPCNMACKFCYATFEDMKIEKQLPIESVQHILTKLREAGLEKITFAGGEPLLYKNLFSAIGFAHEIGLTTSIITNGSLLDDEKLYDYQGILDWIGISIDSTNEHVNNLIGRTSKITPNYYELVAKIKRYGFKLKINTVVNKYNHDRDMNEFIGWAKPDRWKVFQALKVDGQNDKQFDEIKVTDSDFSFFLKTHAHQPSLVAENNEAMTGSYLLIDPLGRLFENSKGKHTYSSLLHDNSIEKCLSEIDINREMFIKRGGVYNW